MSSIRRCLLPQRHRLRESSFRPGTAVVELINCVFAMMPLCKRGGLETRCSGKQKIGVLFLKAAAMGSQICWQRLILVGPHCRKGRKGKFTLWSEDKSSLYNVQARESYYFIEQRVAERTGRLRWVGHMLYILPWLQITIHRHILSVPSKLPYIILLRVMCVIYRRVFSLWCW